MYKTHIWRDGSDNSTTLQFVFPRLMVGVGGGGKLCCTYIQKGNTVQIKLNTQKGRQLWWGGCGKCGFCEYQNVHVLCASWWVLKFKLLLNEWQRTQIRGGNGTKMLYVGGGSARRTLIHWVSLDFLHCFLTHFYGSLYIFLNRFYGSRLDLLRWAMFHVRPVWNNKNEQGQNYGGLLRCE